MHLLNYWQLCCAPQSLETLDNGKPFLQALSVDVAGAISFTRYFAGAADKIVGQTVPAGITIYYFLSQHWKKPSFLGFFKKSFKNLGFLTQFSIPVLAAYLTYSFLLSLVQLSSVQFILGQSLVQLVIYFLYLIIY